tara:strand:+ start:1164 stop:1925 length:762 start_codon:yes stop_codon:yes gene_type:complete
MIHLKVLFLNLYNSLDKTGKLVVTITIIFMSYMGYDNHLIHNQLEYERNMVDSVSVQIQDVHNKTIPSHNNHMTIEEFTHQGQIVQTALDVLMKDVGADRTFIFEFHNTVAMSRGVDEMPINFSLMSCTFESVNIGVKPRCFSLQDIKVPMWNSWVYEITRGGFKYMNTEHISNTVYRAYYVDNNVKSVIVVPIKNRTNETIALMGAEWIKSEFTNVQENSMLVDNFKDASLYLSEQSNNFAEILIRMPNGAI